MRSRRCAKLDHLAEGSVSPAWAWAGLLGRRDPGRQKCRGALVHEAIRILRACWSEEKPSTWESSLNGDRRGPQPPRKRIPIWVGGHTPRALRRVAELGDGWHAAFTPPDAFERDIARLRAECGKVNRRFDDLAITLRVGLSFRDTPGGADRKPLQGTPDQSRRIRRYQALGVGSFLLEARYRDLDDMVAIFERFAREIRSAVEASPRRA